MENHVATATTEIGASAARVWAALTDPELIKEYMFGSEVTTDWRPGSPITWEGEYAGKAYQDRGEIIAIDPGRRLEVTHFSPLSGQEDIPEHYHTLVYELEDRGDRTRVTLSQDKNATREEADHARANWETMLNGLKEVVERG